VLEDSDHSFSIEFLPTGELILWHYCDDSDSHPTSPRSTIRFWDTGRLQEEPALTVKDGITALAVNTNGTLLVVADGAGKLSVWDLEAGTEIALLHSNGKPIGHIEFSPDSTLIATTDGDGTIRLWGIEGD
jgi:WD40 repeat protein